MIPTMRFFRQKFSALLLLTLLWAIPARAATYDLSGSWDVVTSEDWASGGWPVGVPTTGTLSIWQEGDSYDLQISSGFVCDPAWGCSYSQGVVDGADYSAANSGVVDDEGGFVENTMTFTASSATEATGFQYSTYTNGPYFAEWGFDFTLSKCGDDAGIWIAGEDAGIPDAQAEDIWSPDAVLLEDAALADTAQAAEDASADASIVDAGSAQDAAASAGTDAGKDEPEPGCGACAAAGRSTPGTVLWLLGLLWMGLRRRR